MEIKTKCSIMWLISLKVTGNFYAGEGACYPLDRIIIGVLSQLTRTRLLREQETTEVKLLVTENGKS